MKEIKEKKIERYSLSIRVFVDFLVAILSKKIRKNKNKKHINLTWFSRLSTSTGIGRKTFTISKIRIILKKKGIYINFQVLKIQKYP